MSWFLRLGGVRKVNRERKQKGGIEQGRGRRRSKDLDSKRCPGSQDPSRAALIGLILNYTSGAWRSRVEGTFQGALWMSVIGKDTPGTLRNNTSSGQEHELITAVTGVALASGFLNGWSIHAEINPI